MIKLPPWAEQVNAAGVQRVAQAMGLYGAGRLTCPDCAGWAAIREDDRIWNCAECESTGSPLILASLIFWKQTGTESPTPADWERLVGILAALGLCEI